MPRRYTVLATLLPALAAAQVPSAKVIERYKQLLVANPAEGTALERLWQAYSTEGRTGALLAEFEAQKTGPGQMLFGLLLRKAGRDADAIAAFERAAKLDPKNAAPALALGRVELASGHALEAGGWFEKAADLLPAGPQKIEALMQLGAAALAAANLDQATDAWEKTAALAPDDLALRQQLADTYVRHQLGPRAIPHLEYIEQHGPAQERAQALRQIGAIHQAHGEQDAAIAALEKALALTSPGNWLRADLEGQIVRLYQRYHRVPELEEKWRKFAAENPRDLGAILQLIDLYERLGDQPQQLAWLEKLAAAAPKNLDYRLRLARLLAQLDQIDRAIGAYDELLGSNPRNIELVFERARLDVQREQPQRAGERIAALLSRAGNDEGVRGKALEFYQTHRLYELAEKHLKEDASGGDADALVALATFYFNRHRDAEARAALARVVRDTDPPEKRAAAHFRLAGELKAQNDMVAATNSVRAALELDPNVREYHFALGELETATGHYVGAETAFERAYALSETAEDAASADQRLYDSLRNQKEPGEDPPQVSIPRPDSAASVTSAAAQSYLLKLLRAAVDQPSEQRWLRVARWQQWSRNLRGANDAAERALAINAESIPVHDFLARLNAGDPQSTGTQQHLLELARLDPPNRAAYLRRLGQAYLQGGQIEEGLTTFRRIASENPGELDALHDLALAQQRANQWTESLETLKQLYTLSPAPRKRDVVTALLRVYDHLGLRPQAAELLFQQVDAVAGDDQFSLFADLLAHCTKHRLLDWLRTQFEQRQKLRIGDYFTEVALGRVLKAQGNKAAAFEVLADAAISAPNPGEALPELVREAEELHRLEAAVTLQDRFVRVVPQTGPDGWLKLAELQERSLQPEAAAATWARLVTKFPRDVIVLEKAAAFERVWGRPERALAALRRIRAIEPSNAPALTQLAELDITDGDPVEARKCLEQLLAQSEPEKPDAPVRFPDVRPDDPSRVELSYRTAVHRRSGRPSAETLKVLRTFWVDKTPPGAASAGLQQRLNTIQELAELIAAQGDAAELNRWVERWRHPAAGPSERLWALYFSGASGPLLDEVEKLASDKHGENPAPVNAFVWLALQTGEFERLGRWNNDPQRTPPERDFLMIAIEQYLDDHQGPVPAALVENVFSNENRANLWQAAGKLAERGQYASAVQLGERVLARLKIQRAPYAVELAQWQLQLGRIDAATTTLRSAFDGTYDSLDPFFYGALRAVYLLLPEGERSGLMREIEGRLDDVSRPVQAPLTRALLAGLRGDERAARTQLDTLFALRPMLAGSDERSTAATRRWDFNLFAGAQLMTWRLPGLASYFWEKALADEASIALQVQPQDPSADAVRARVAEVRTRATALQLMRGEPGEADAALDLYTRHAPPDGLLPLAEILESFNANPLAITIYRRLWALEPSNPHALRNAVAAGRNAEDWSTMEEILTRVVTEGYFKQNPVAHRDLVQQLVEALVKRGDYEASCRYLGEATQGAPPDARLLARLADLQKSAGKTSDAVATYQRALTLEPANATIRLAFAALLEGEGKTVEAIDVLERATGGEIDARLATLNLKAGRGEEALAALERLPDTDRPRAALTLANDLATAGQSDRAVRLLRFTLGRTREAKMAFSLQSRLVELLPGGVDRAALQLDLRKLRRAAGADPAGLANYFALLQREAPRLGCEAELRDEINRAWEGGRGEVAAGAALLAGQVARGEREAALASWKRLLAHPMLDVGALRIVLEVFPAEVWREPRLEALERLARLDAGDAGRLIAWATALHEAGRKPEAMQVAGELAARTVFNGDLLAQAAALFATLGDEEKARQSFAQASALDPAGQKVELHLGFAQLLTRQNRFGEARHELRIVSRNPAARPASALIGYLTASSHLADFEEHLVDFTLSPAVRKEVQSGVFAALLQGGDVAGAVQIAQTYPFLLEGTGPARLRESTRNAQQFEATVVVLENALSQGAKALTPDLAGLLADWAEVELAALQVDSALMHLDRAHELQAGSWRITERLAKLRLERNEPVLATKVLNAFLSIATDPFEVDKARQLLARIPTS